MGVEHSYLLVNAGILVLPLAFSFERRIAYFRRWRELSLAIGAVSGGYILWDILAARAGHWSFNGAFSGAVRVAGLPVGEILFFITVPYACLFIYEATKSFSKPLQQLESRAGVRARRSSTLIGVAAATPFVILAVAWRAQGYTAAAFTSVALLIVAISIVDPDMAKDRRCWFFIVISYVPFFVVNSVLTALPIVEYGESAIWGIRLGTIPLEDLFYNFAMLGFYLLVYRFFSARRDRRQRNAA